MDKRDMAKVWADFVFDGKLSADVRTPIAASWQKCRAAGVNPAGGEGRHIDEHILASVRDENKLFLDIAVPIMQRLYSFIPKPGFMLVITDSAGYLLEVIGDESLLSMAEDMRFAPGALWSDLEVGTNAISVALDYDMSIQLNGYEHYCTSHHGWVCAAAPIHGPNGEIIGCIDFSGLESNFTKHTLALVQSVAHGIEGQVRQAHNIMVMLAALENSMDSIVLLDHNYEAVWINSAASRLLETDLEGLKVTGVRNILPIFDWESNYWKNGDRFISDNIKLNVKGSVKYCSIVASPLSGYGSMTLSVTLRQQNHIINTVNKLSGNRAVYQFSDFYTCNESMRKKLALAATFARYEGNILIQGESGTGKEVLAQAIHNAGKNAKGPFVVVNCASIPRELFEMELFGYESDAFPASNAEGKPGRFEFAQNGTLFLDEVSTMPLEVQSKLLRAVETHSVQRLGSTQDIHLNIRIIAATNQNLARMVEKGEFRKDMYYRLSALMLDIPPLRERPEDIELCAHRFLQKLNENSMSPPKSMSQEFIDGLKQYDWPGNTRQLQNGLARAYYISGENTLTAADLELAVEKREAPAGAPMRSKDGGEASIIAALTVCRGDVDATAECLGVSRATLYRRMKQYGISPKQIKY